MKFGYTTVALPTLLIEEAAQAVAAHGFAGVEWKTGEAPHAMGSSAQAFLVGNRATVDLTVESALRARKACDDAGVALIGLCPYVDLGDDAAWAQVVDMAAASAAPQVRWQGPRMAAHDGSYAELFDACVAFVERAAERCAAQDVRMVVEIHQLTAFPSASLVHRLVSRFDPAIVGVIYDVGNLVREGAEDPDIALDLLGPWLHHVHLKNVRAVHAESPTTRTWTYEWSPLDDGFLDVAATLRTLADHGYDGWVSMEDLSTDRSPVGTMRHNAEVLTGIAAPGW